ncbi:MAG: universal stress protein [candidate division KSB1 bacterium]|nr:universal stress protein [candidate division KSB1 bacterium]
MFKKILFPTDFGEFAGHLSMCLADLQSAGLEEVVLLHVIDVDELNRNLLASFREADEARHREIAHIKLAEQVQTLQKRGVRVKALVTTGIPSNEIVRVAEAESVSLILGGTQRRRGKDEDKLDTTTSRVIRKSKLPVLVIKLTEDEMTSPSRCDKFCHRLFSKVLYPTDWSECAKATLEQVTKLHEVTGQVVVSHVMDQRGLRLVDAAKIEEFRQNDLRRLEEVKAELKQRGFSVHTHLHVGSPFVEINRVADEENASLIVIGKKGKTGLKEIIWGSTSEQVVRHSNRSVLVFHCCD